MKSSYELKTISYTYSTEVSVQTGRIKGSKFFSNSDVHSDFAFTN